jgi:hypothetical protein
MRVVRRWARRIAVGLAVMVWIAAPVALAVVLTARSKDAVSAPAAQPVWTPAIEAASSTRVPATAYGAWSTASGLVAPAWSGLVQEVLIHPGSVVQSGTPLVVMDGQTKIALQTPRPFTKPLGVADDQTPEVRMLNDALRSLGLPASPDDRFGTNTLAGVQKLAASLNVTKAVAFDPAWVAWLPVPSVTVSSVSFQVAIPAPGAGSTFAEVQPSLTGARLYQVDQTGPGATDPNAGGGAGSAGVGGGSSGPGTGATPGGAPTTVPPPKTGLVGNLPDGATVAVGDQVLGKVAADGTLSPEAAAALAGLTTSAQPTLGVDIVEPRAAGTRQVPPAAVITGATGVSCVVHRSYPGGRALVDKVIVTSSDIDVADAIGLPDGPVEVLVDPPLRDRARCR